MTRQKEDDKENVNFSIYLPIEVAFHYREDGTHYVSVEWDKIQVQKNLVPYSAKNVKEEKFLKDSKIELEFLICVMEAVLAQDFETLAQLLSPIFNVERPDKTTLH